MGSAAGTPFYLAIRSDHTVLELPRDRHWIQPALSYIARRCKLNGLRHDLAQMRLSLACREALEQAIRRSTGTNKPIGLTLQVDAEGCTLSLSDDRPWMEPNRLADSTGLTNAPDRRRLNLIRTLVDHFELAEDCKTLKLRVRRPSALDPVRPSAIPFVNPVEVFPLQVDGCIDYDMAYQAIFRDVTDSSISILQQGAKVPRRACVGVYGAGRLYFLPVHLDVQRELASGLHEAVFRIGSPSGSDKLPRPRLDAPFAEAQVVDSVHTIVAEMEANPSSARLRRAHERVVFSDRPVRLLGAPNQRPIFARDFSIGGLALITTFPLQLGDVHTIEVGEVGGLVTKVRLRIVRCVSLVDEFFDVGGEFVDGDGSTQPPTIT